MYASIFHLQARVHLVNKHTNGIHAPAKAYIVSCSLVVKSFQTILTGVVSAGVGLLSDEQGERRATPGSDGTQSLPRRDATLEVSLATRQQREHLGSRLATVAKRRQNIKTVRAVRAAWRAPRQNVE